jgi:hypothetical protein
VFDADTVQKLRDSAGVKAKELEIIDPEGKEDYIDLRMKAEILKLLTDEKGGAFELSRLAQKDDVAAMIFYLWGLEHGNTGR